VPVIAFADHVQVEVETRDVGFLRPGECQAAIGRMRRVVDIEWVAAEVAGRDALDLERQDIGYRGRAPEPLDANLDRLELDPAEVADEVLANERRRAAGFAPTMAASAVRCRSLARASTTPAKIQLPSAITRPERITSANLSPSSLVSPE
jgi:hypothetical protein